MKPQPMGDPLLYRDGDPQSYRCGEYGGRASRDDVTEDMT